MNIHIRAQITNMIMLTKNFEQSCIIAAKMDDDKVSKAEAKTLKKINAATQQFIKELEKLRQSDGFVDLDELARLFRRKSA